MEIVRIPTGKVASNKGQVEGLPSNPRQWTLSDVERIAESLKQTPELFEARPLIVLPHEGKYVILGGNLRYEGAKKLKLKGVPAIVMPETTPADKLKEIVIKDNGSFGAWDYDALGNEWDDLPLVQWGVPAWDTEAGEQTDEDEIERKRREFEERMAAGEISEEDEEYQEFLDKFKLKKTTDDCYTPTIVHEAVVEFVERKYKLHRASFVRPFYPGGDYQHEKYPQGCVVVDNPPFSILAEILNFYKDNGIRFFLYGPSLTLFSSSSSCTTLPLCVPITYENGATVSTSFLTNLEPKGIRFRSEPELYRMVKEANDENLATMRKTLPKYSYDHHIITSPFVGALSRLGIEFSVPVAESESIAQLDSQKESGKAIYGKGYIVSERIYAEREKAEREKAEREKAEREKAEREKAEREKAEREKAERWELSAREKAIIEKLSR